MARHKNRSCFVDAGMEQLLGGWLGGRGAQEGADVARIQAAWRGYAWRRNQPLLRGVSLVSIVSLQAAWRGYAVRRGLPRLLVRCYVRRAQAGLSMRSKSKAWIRARNRKIHLLRLELTAAPSGISDFWHRRDLGVELQRQVMHERHRERGAVTVQSWWRGCLLRGRGPRYRAAVTVQSWWRRCRVGGWPGRRGERAPGAAEPSQQALKMPPVLDVPAYLFEGMLTIPQLPWGSDEGRHLQDGSASLPWTGGRGAALEWPSMSSFTSPLQSMTSAFIAGAMWQEQASADPGARRARRRTQTLGTSPHTMHMPRRVLVLYSDTGGGHRASALALQAAMRQQYGKDVHVDLLDFIREVGPWPWSNAPEAYQFMGQLPSVYKKVYESYGRDRSWRETMTFKMIWFFSREKVLQFMNTRVVADIDLIISVHPLVHHFVLEALEEMEGESVPVVTVVTDLGTAHLSWFDPRVSLLFVPSERILQLACDHDVPKERIHLCGLPVREGFWHADGDRAAGSSKGTMREKLGLAPGEEAGVVLVMGGGDGFGNLVQVAISIGNRLAKLERGQMVVICGRNEEVRTALERWASTRHNGHDPARPPQILGFVPNVDAYMSAADCVVTKAGPGTIAEAMVKSLPCLLTSFMPGQEDGNVTFVTENSAGEYVSDADPEGVADTIAAWLGDPPLLNRMSQCAGRLGRPQASLDITRRICDSLLGFGVELSFVPAEGTCKVIVDSDGDGYCSDNSVCEPQPEPMPPSQT